MRRNLITSAFLALVIVMTVSALGPGRNVCSRRETYLVRLRRCAYYFWGRCCRYVYFWKCKYRTVYFCCAGWRQRGSSCSIPICNPVCTNNGRCVRPNVCQCPSAFTGATCQSKACSAMFPCYPGVCPGPTASSCVCRTGYYSTREHECNRMRPSLKPEITNMMSEFYEFERSSNMELYRMTADATVDNETDLVTFWSNQHKFNKLSVSFEGLYEEKSAFSPSRDYVTKFGVGVVSASITVQHYKIEFGDANKKRKTNNNWNFQCQTISWRNPFSLYNCTNLFDRAFPRLEHYDEVEITATVSSGGFKNVKGRGDLQIIGTSVSKKTFYKFDLRKPTHCFISNSCGGTETPLKIYNGDLHTDTIKFTWTGWVDKYSGIHRYVWEVYRLEKDRDGFLTERARKSRYPDKIVPLSNTASSGAYKPTTAGVYSIILQVADKANNSQYVRRLVLYDPAPKVTITNKPLYITSAASATHFTWQSSISNNIEVVWTGHFENTVHREQGLLNKAHKYPAVPGIFGWNSKIFDEGYDDNEGQRSLQPVPNFNGIVKFEYGYALSDQERKPQKWNEVQPFNESVVFNAARNDGDALRVFVRATDIFDNTKEDFATIRFDTTPPQIKKPSYKAETAPHMEFSSMLDVYSKDPESGTWIIQTDFVLSKTNKTVHSHKQETTTITKTECDSNRDCYKTDDNHYYLATVLIPFDHCWIQVPKEFLKTNLKICFTAVNMALLRTPYDDCIEVGPVNKLSGLEKYYAPENVTTVDVTTTSATIKWVNVNNCYNRTGIHYRFISSDASQEKDVTLDGDRNEFSLNGLKSDTNYSLAFSIMYANGESEMLRFYFKTEPVRISTGELAGLVIGLLLLIIIVILIVLMIVFRRRAPVQKVIRSVTTRFTSRGAGSHFAAKKRGPFTGVSFRSNEDYMYTYGNVADDLNADWVIPSSNLRLLDHIKSGRFASIYTAVLGGHHEKKRNVAAKVLKEKHSQDDEKLMKTKMNFMAGELNPGHENVLGFIGGVLDNPQGPIIVMELCAAGTLKDWLSSQRNNVDENLMECLYKFSVEIARGMQFLANKNIVHRKLAARNVLLTTDLTPKIAGFGPTTADDDDNDDNRRERIPIKWVAPECVKSIKKATEKSDVWSFGIVQWEIFSLGDTPYAEIDNSELPIAIEKGHRLSRPEFCPDTYYGIMVRCWAYKPSRRPTFKAIVVEHLNMYNSTTSYYN